MRKLRGRFAVPGEWWITADVTRAVIPATSHWPWLRGCFPYERVRTAFEAQQMPSEHAAINRAKLMSRTYAGVIAWKRPAKPDEGEFGEPKVLYQAGDVPDLE